jgi:hypothetical protein
VVEEQAAQHAGNSLPDLRDAVIKSVVALLSRDGDFAILPGYHPQHVGGEQAERVVA